MMKKLILISALLFSFNGWVEDTFYRIKECLHSEVCPEHATTGFGYKGDKQCENAETFEGMKANNISL